MPWIKVKGLPGLVYEPEGAGGDSCGKKKHPCPDCFCCQWCSDERCRECLKRKSCRKRKPRS